MRDVWVTTTRWCDVTVSVRNTCCESLPTSCVSLLVPVLSTYLCQYWVPTCVCLRWTYLCLLTMNLLVSPYVEPTSVCLRWTYLCLLTMNLLVFAYSVPTCVCVKCSYLFLRTVLRVHIYVCVVYLLVFT